MPPDSRRGPHRPRTAERARLEIARMTHARPRLVRAHAAPRPNQRRRSRQGASDLGVSVPSASSGQPPTAVVQGRSSSRRTSFRMLTPARPMAIAFAGGRPLCCAGQPLSQGYGRECGGCEAPPLVGYPSGGTGAGLKPAPTTVIELVLQGPHADGDAGAPAQRGRDVGGEWLAGVDRLAPGLEVEVLRPDRDEERIGSAVDFDAVNFVAGLRL